MAEVLRRLAREPRERRIEVLRSMDPTVVRELLRAAAMRSPAEVRARIAAEARKRTDEYVPQDDDELWEFVRRETGYAIPRTAVVPGNRAPFELLADLFFERGLKDKLVIGNRGSGKTLTLAVFHSVSLRLKPKFTSATVGAVEAQAKRCYAVVKAVFKTRSWARFVLGGERGVKMAGTEMLSGSKVEVVVGTMSGVNSPHPNVAHFDEVELFRPGVLEEGLNMAQGSNGYRASNVYTSSWKFVRGEVSRRIQEVREALAKGVRPPFEIYRWGVWESTKRCEADCSNCPYATFVRGDWGPEAGREDLPPKPRSFESACKKDSPFVAEDGSTLGKLKRADGHIDVEDSASRFVMLSRRAWESQQESQRPTAEGLIYSEWDEAAKDLSPEMEPEDALAYPGRIWVSIDFGGTDPHAVGFWLETDAEIMVGDGRRVPKGASVRFAEVHAPGIGNVELGRRINRKLLELGIDRFADESDGGRDVIFVADAAQKAGRLDLRKLGMNADDEESDDPELAPINASPVPKPEVQARIGHVQSEIIGSDSLWVVGSACPGFLDEIGQYELNPDTGKPRGADHHMDEMGYHFWARHLERIGRWRPLGTPLTGEPAAIPRKQPAPVRRSTARVRGVARPSPNRPREADVLVPAGMASSAPMVSNRATTHFTGSPFDRMGRR